MQANIRPQAESLGLHKLSQLGARTLSEPALAWRESLWTRDFSRSCVLTCIGGSIPMQANIRPQAFSLWLHKLSSALAWTLNDAALAWRESLWTRDFSRSCVLTCIGMHLTTIDFSQFDFLRELLDANKGIY